MISLLSFSNFLVNPETVRGRPERLKLKSTQLNGNESEEEEKDDDEGCRGERWTLIIFIRQTHVASQTFTSHYFIHQESKPVNATAIPSSTSSHPIFYSISYQWKRKWWKNIFISISRTVKIFTFHINPFLNLFCSSGGGGGGGPESGS